MAKPELVAILDAAPLPVAGQPSEHRYADLAPVFRALGDPIRLRLLSLIASHDGGEACVCELTGPFDVSQPAISHHLRILRQAGLVTSERRGTWVYYRVPPVWIGVLESVLEQAVGAPVLTPSA